MPFTDMHTWHLQIMTLETSSIRPCILPLVGPSGIAGVPGHDCGASAKSAAPAAHIKPPRCTRHPADSPALMLYQI